TATRLANITAHNTMGALMVNRCNTSDVTDWPVEMETPRSALSTLPNQIAICSGRLRSRPNCLCSSCRLAGSPMSPSISAAGSPGIRRISMNTVTPTISGVGVDIATRAHINRNVVRYPMSNGQRKPLEDWLDRRHNGDLHHPLGRTHQHSGGGRAQ